MICHSIGLPPTSTIGLGRKTVSSDKRDPKPPARITTFIVLSPIRPWLLHRCRPLLHHCNDVLYLFLRKRRIERQGHYSRSHLFCSWQALRLTRGFVVRKGVHRRVVNACLYSFIAHERHEWLPCTARF